MNDCFKTSLVNSSSKFLTSVLLDISGIKGGFIFLLETKSQSILEKNGCPLNSEIPSLVPNLVFMFLSRNFVIRS